MANLPNIRRSRAVAPAVPAAAPSRSPEPAVKRLEAHGLVWLDIERPTVVETAWLGEHYGFHELDLEDVLSRSRQRAKIDEYDDYVFIVLHFPRYDKGRARLHAVELNLFIADGLLITLPNEPLRPIANLWHRCVGSEEARAAVMGKGAGQLLYTVVDEMFDECFPMLDKIGWKLDALEEQIFAGRSHEVVREISNVTHEIINYRKVIKPQRGTLRMLERATQRFAREDLELYFDDIVDKSERIWDGLENYKEVVEALEATNSSVVTHRLNELIRALTLLSAVILPLTLVTGFYGQNIDALPLAHHGIWSVLYTLVLMAGFAAGLLWWFRRRNWL